MKKIDIYEYIISNNPTAIKPLLAKYGKNYPDNWDNYSQEEKLVIIRNTMRNLILDGNEEFKNDMLSLHPDKDVLEEYLLNKNHDKFFADDKKAETKGQPKVEVKSSTPNPNKNILNITDKHKNILLGIGIALAGGFIIKKLV